MAQKVRPNDQVLRADHLHRNQSAVLIHKAQRKCSFSLCRLIYMIEIVFHGIKIVVTSNVVGLKLNELVGRCLCN